MGKRTGRRRRNSRRSDALAVPVGGVDRDAVVAPRAVVTADVRSAAAATFSKIAEASSIRSRPASPDRTNWAGGWDSQGTDGLRVSNSARLEPSRAASDRKASRSACSNSSSRPGAPVGNPAMFSTPSQMSREGRSCRYSTTHWRCCWGFKSAKSSPAREVPSRRVPRRPPPDPSQPASPSGSCPTTPARTGRRAPAGSSS